MTSEPRTAAPATPWLTTHQAFLLGLLLGALAVGNLVLSLAAPESARLLWSESLGLNMVSGALGILVVGMVLYVVGFAVVNRFHRVGGTRTPLYWLLSSILLAVFGIGFYLPAWFVLLIGPSAIQVQQAMLLP